MGTINAIRLINISYNNGGIRINDETLNMNGVNTLLSLQNGGGKSVLVQMLTAPFVHKKYRNAGDRIFAGYFTGTKPSFILIEWLLDNGAGKLMNGFMIRRSIEETGTEGEQKDDLEIISVISIYKNECRRDINHLPVVEKTKNEMNLKNFSVCRQLFEELKKESHSDFYYYDMNHGVQQRQYFDKLREYKIDYREWENIIKKVNLKEGGLIDLFSDCKDEKGLTEKWFLEAVEKKLDPEGSRIMNFGKNMASHARQCYQNADKIKRKEDIALFERLVSSEDDGEIQSIKRMAQVADDNVKKTLDKKNKLKTFYKKMVELSSYAEEEINALKESEDEKRENIKYIKYEKFSSEIQEIIRQIEEAERNREITFIEIDGLDREIKSLEKKLHIIEARSQEEIRRKEYAEREELVAQLEVIKRKDEDLGPARNELGEKLYLAYDGLCEENEKRINDENDSINSLEGKLSEKQKIIKETDEKLSKLERELGKLESDISSFDDLEEEYNKRFKCQYCRNIIGEYEQGFLKIEESELQKKLTDAIRTKKKEKEEQEKRERLDRKLESDISSARIRHNSLEHDLQNSEEKVEDYKRQIDERKDILSYIHFSEKNIFDTEEILHAFDAKLEIQGADIRKLEDSEKKLKNELTMYRDGRVSELPDSISKLFDVAGVNTFFGMKWLKKNGRSQKENAKLVKENPFLPYSLIVTADEFERLKAVDANVENAAPVPILLRSDLEKGIIFDTANSGG
ncbi:MAG: hypothetical protein K5894_16305, partial [Lachnospiraceae bacterium]|nr:hypothetical protein [Lachnospiraceae bacterium]